MRTQRKELVQLVRKLIEAHARKLDNVCKLTDTGIDDFKNIFAPIYEVVKEKQHEHSWLKNLRKELTKLAHMVTDARELNDARKLTDAQRNTEMQKYNAAERIVDRIAEYIAEHVKSVRKLPVAEATVIMRQRLEIEASQSFYTSNDFEEGRSGLWVSEVAQLDSVKSLKAKAYAQKAQYQAKDKELARAREELVKLNAEEEV